MTRLYSGNRVRKFLKACKNAGITYHQFEEVSGVNRYYYWKVVNDENYKIPEHIIDKLDAHSKADLFALEPKDLLWKLQHREDWRGNDRDSSAVHSGD